MSDLVVNPLDVLTEPERLALWIKLRSRSIFAANGCWIWMRGRSKAGYGQTGLFGIVHYVHRVGYWLLVGGFPKDRELDHSCKNPACWNPEHLEPVTHEVNILRGESPYAKKARQTHCKYGHPFDGENLHIRPSDGTRDCRICMRRRWREREQRRKQRSLP